MAESAGSISVEVVPDARNFVKKLQSTLLPAASKMGEEFGKTLGESAAKRIQAALKDAFKNGPGDTTAPATKKGEEYGGAFATSLKAKLEQALRSLPDIKINADSSDADRAIAGIREDLQTLQSRRIGIDISEEEALTKLTQLRAQLDRLGAESVSAEVKVNTAAASSSLREFQAQLDKLAAKKTDVKVDADWQGGFDQRLKSKLQAALANLPKAELDANSTDADRAIQRVRSEIENLHGQRIGIDVSSDQAMAQLLALQAELDRIGAASPNVQTRVDTLSASAELAAFQAEVTRLSHEHPTVKVDANTASAQAQLLALRGAAAGGAGGVSVLTLAIAGIGPALIPIAGVGVGVFGAIGAAAGAAGAAVGVLALALGPVISAVTAVAGAHDKSGAAAARSAGNTSQLANAQDGLKSALKGVQTAEQDAADARIRSAEQIANAQRGLQEATRAAAQDQIESGRRIADAEQTLADARRSSAQDQIESARRIADAQRNLQDAQQQATDRISQADRNVAQAERSLADTQRSVLTAQQNLNQAREQAVRDAKELSARLADAKLDERGAVLDVQDAETELNKLRARGATEQNEAFQKAQLNYDRSVQRLKELKDQNQQLAADKAASDKAGVDGSKGVQSAQQALSDAQQKQVDAQQTLVDAQKNADKARVDSARQVADAQRSLADAVSAAAQRQEADQRRIIQAQQGVTDAVSASAERQRQDQLKIADAQRSVTDAQRSAAEQARHSADSIASAQQSVVQAHRAVADAAKSSGAVGGAAVDTVAQKLAALSPEGRKFVKFVTSELLPAFKGLSQTAQTAFLPGLQAGIKAVLPQLSGLKDFVKSVGGTLGGLAESAGKGLTSPVWTQFFSYIGSIAGPTIESIGKSFGNFASGLAGILPLFEPIRKLLFNGLLEISKKFADFGKNAGTNPQFQAFLRYIKENGPLVFKTLGDIVGAAGHIVKSLAPIGPVVVKVVDAIANFIKTIPPGVLSALVLGFVGLAGAFKLVGATAAVITGVSNAVKAFGLAMDLLEANPVILAITAIILVIVAIGIAVYEAYQHWEPFRNAVNSAWDAIKKASVSAWEGFLKPTFTAIKDFIMNTLIPAFMWLWKNVIVPAWDGIVKAGVDAWNNFIQPTFVAIKKFIDDVLAPVFTWLWNNIIKPAWAGIQLEIKVAWAIIEVIFKAVKLFIETVLAPVFTWLWNNIIKPAWAGIQLIITTSWNAIQLILKAAKLFIETVLAPVFTWLWNTIIKPTWDGISKTISTVWTNGIKPILTTVGDYIKTTVAPAFEKGVAAIKTAWDKVQNVAKVPVKFIISTIINDGIIGSWNKVAGWFGVKPVGQVALPQGFATGGHIQGPGSGVSDDIPIMVSNGEWVVRAAAAKKLGPETMNAINNADKFDITGDPSAFKVRALHGFATGGVVDPKIMERVQAVKAWLPSVDPLPYVMGGVGPGTYDCSGLVGEVWARLTGRPSFRRNFTTLNLAQNPGAFGFAPGPGMFTVGVNDSRVPGAQKGSSQHTDGNLNGLGFEAAGRASGIKIGGAAQSPSNFAKVIHLESLGTAGAGSGGGGIAVPTPPEGISITDPVGSLKTLLSGPLKNMSGAGQNQFADLVRNLPGRVVGAAMSKIADVAKNIATAPFSGFQAAVSLISGGAKSVWNKAKSLIGFANGGLVQYDNGGWLPQGISSVINNTGSPEPILNSSQWDSLRENRGGGGGTTTIGSLTIQMPTTAGTLDMLSHGDRLRAARAIHEELSKLGKGYGS